MITLTVLDIAMIIDTLQGSIQIADGQGTIFKYKMESRMELCNRLAHQAHETELEAQEI